MGNPRFSIASLHVHPVKSCAGLSLPQAQLSATGLKDDRRWMVVTPDGKPLTQREDPRMALVAPAVGPEGLRLSAPGMPDLPARPSGPGQAAKVEVWGTGLDAHDAGDEAAAWLQRFLGRPLRLVRFDADQPPRLASRKWTGGIEAPTMFADEFPLLVVSTAGLAELNRRLALDGQSPVGMERFRPNLVLHGLEDANAEDFLGELRLQAAEGPVVLKLVKPCVRCTIPGVDPRTGEAGTAVPDALASYRADSRMDGGITFGMNAVIVEGTGRTLAVGMQGEATLAF